MRQPDACPCGNRAGFNPRPALRPGDAGVRTDYEVVEVLVSIRARP